MADETKTTLRTEIDLFLSPDKLKLTEEQFSDLRDQLAEVVDVLEEVEGGVAGIGDSDGIKEVSDQLDNLTKNLEEARKVITDPVLLGKIDRKIADLRGQVNQTAIKVRQRERNEALDERYNKFEQVRRGAMDFAEPFTNASSNFLSYMSDSAAQFVDNAGRADKVSRAWLNTNDDIASSQMRIGRVMATTMLPVMETVAHVMDKIASFAEAHPGAVMAAAGLAGTIAAAASMAATVGAAVQAFLAAGPLWATISSLAGIGGTAAAGTAVAGGAAAAGTAVAGGAAVAGTAAAGGGIMASITAALATIGAGIVGILTSPVTIGVVIAGITSEIFSGDWDKELSELTGWQVNFTAVNESIAAGSKTLVDIMSWIPGPLGALANLNKEFGGGQMKFNPEMFSQGAVVLAAGLDKITETLGFTGEGTQTFATRTAQYWGFLGNEAGKATEKVNETTNALSALANSPKAGQALDAFIAYNDEEAMATKQHEAQKAEIIADAEAQRLESEASYEDSRTQFIEEFGEQRVQAEEDFAEQQADAAADFAKEGLRAERDYGKQRAKAAKSYTKEALKAEDEYQKSLADFLESAQREDSEAEESYYESRTELIEDAGEADIEAEADHQKTMRRMAEDHSERLTDAIRNRDAIGFLQEQRSYQKERSRAEEDYRDSQNLQDKELQKQITDLEEGFAKEGEARIEERARTLAEMAEDYANQKAERAEQYAEEQAEAAVEYAEQKAERAEQYDEQQAEATVQFEKQKLRENEQYAKTLTDMDEQHQKELDAIDKQEAASLASLQKQFDAESEMRKTAFADQLRDLDAALLGEQEKKNQYYDQMEEDFGQWLTDMGGQLQTAKAGYDPNSTTNMSTTKNSGGNTSNQNIVNQQNNFPASNGEITSIANAVKGAVVQAIYEFSKGNAG